MSEIPPQLIEALASATSGDKPTRVRGEEALNAALASHADTVLPALIQVSGNSAIRGPAVSELAAIMAKNYLLHYSGDAEVWEQQIVPPARIAVFSQLPTATAPARRVLLEALRLLMQDNPWPELVDSVVDELTAQLEIVHRNVSNNGGNNDQAIHRIVCALEAALVHTTNFKMFGFVSAQIQNETAERMLPLLPPVFQLGRTDAAHYALKIFECFVCHNTPPSLRPATGQLSAWFNEMLSFPAKFFAASQQSKDSYRHYIKCVKRIALIAIQVVALGPDPAANPQQQQQQQQQDSKKKKGGRRSRIFRVLADAPHTPKVYGFTGKFTAFFVNFINYVATTTAEANSFLSSGSGRGNKRGGGGGGGGAGAASTYETAEMLREPALSALRFLKYTLEQDAPCWMLEEGQEGGGAASNKRVIDLSQFAQSLFTFVPFNDDDAELWDMEPREYLRQIEDPEGQELSLRSRATKMLEELVTPQRVWEHHHHHQFADLKRGQKPPKRFPPLMPLEEVLQHMIQFIQQGVESDAAAKQNDNNNSNNSRRNNDEDDSAATNLDLASVRTDGALFVIAHLRSRIMKQQNLWSRIAVDLLTRLVAPLLSHKSSVVRAKAIWICGAYSDAPFPADGGNNNNNNNNNQQDDESANSEMFNQMVQAVMSRINDSHPGVRAQVVTSTVQFIAQPRARSIMYSVLHPLVDECLRLLETVSTAQVVISLQCLIECFGPELRGQIYNICDRLIQSILATNFELQSIDMEAAANAEGFEGEVTGANAKSHEQERARFESLSAVMQGELRTLDKSIEAMGQNDTLIRRMQPRIGQMLLQIMKNDGEFDGYLDLALNIFSDVLLYAVPASFWLGNNNNNNNSGAQQQQQQPVILDRATTVDQSLWDCLPILYDITANGGCEYFSLIARPLDNFVSLFPCVFACANSQELTGLLGACKTMLDLIGDDVVSDKEIEAAPMLLSSLLENVAASTGSFESQSDFDKIVTMLVTGLFAASKHRSKIKGSLCVALLDCFIMDTARTATLLDNPRLGGAAVFLTEFVKFYKQKCATQFNTSRLRTKVVVLGLVSILKSWLQIAAAGGAAPPPPGTRELLEVIVHAMRALKTLHEAWLEQHSDEKLQLAARGGPSGRSKFFDEDEDEDNNNNNNNNANENEGAGGDDDEEGDDDDDDDIMSDDEDDDDDEDGDGDITSPLDRVNEAQIVADFFGSLPGEWVQQLNLNGLITQPDVAECVNLSRGVVERNLELLRMDAVDQQRRAEEMEQFQQQQQQQNHQ